MDRLYDIQIGLCVFKAFFPLLYIFLNYTLEAIYGYA